MNYWIIALPREDMEHCIKIGTFGLNRKHNMGKVTKDDKVVCYVTKECKIIALGEVTSDYYMDTRKVFHSDGLFPDRFNFKAQQLEVKDELDFKSMVDELSFITNKLYWSVYLRAGIAQIPQEDWTLIQKKVKIGALV